jgi:hypothetical protein
MSLKNDMTVSELSEQPMMNLGYLHSNKELFKSGGKPFILFSIAVNNDERSIQCFNNIKLELYRFEIQFKKFLVDNGIIGVGIRTVIITNIGLDNPNRNIFKHMEFSDPYVFTFHTLENNIKGPESIIIRIDCSTFESKIEIFGDYCECFMYNSIGDLEKTIKKSIGLNNTKLLRSIRNYNNKHRGITIELGPNIEIDSKVGWWFYIRQAINSPLRLFKS